MKKLLTILALMFAVNSTAMAAEINKPEINLESGVVSVSGELGTVFASRRVTLIVKKDTDGTINWFDSIKCNDQGKYSFNYLMKGINGERYTTYISVENSDARYDSSFVFYDATQENAALWTRIQEGKLTKDVSVMKDIINTRWEYLNLNKEMYDTFSEELKDKVCVSMYDAIDSMSGFKTKFSEVCAVWNLNSLESEQIEQYANDLEELIDGKAESAKKIIKNLSDGEKQQIYSDMIVKDYTNMDSLVADYNKLVILTAANRAKIWGETKTLLEDSCTLLKIDFSTYNSLKDKITPISKMLKNYSSLEEIANTFISVVNEQYNLEKSNSGSGSSGGGGATTGTKSSLTGVTINGPVKIEENQSVVTTFSDIDDVKWAQDSIVLLANRGIVSGYDGNFYPNNKINRAEFVKILMCYFDFNNQNRESVEFSDVSENQWFYGYINRAYENEIINGVSEDKFCPLDNITRQDMAVIIYNSISKKKEMTQSSPDFEDSGAISDYAKIAVGTLKSSGIINGFDDGTFRPLNYATRAEAAVMVSNIIRYMENSAN